MESIKVELPILLRKIVKFRILSLLLSTSFALMLSEGVIRIVSSDLQIEPVDPTWNQYEFYRYDPILGWGNTPGAEGEYRREEFSYSVVVNDLGMRQRQVSKEKDDDEFRVVFLGDSFLWGIGVSDPDRVTERLEQKLKNVEALNLGVSGYAPIQYTLMEKQVTSLKPDLVVLLFCLWNDFSDNVLFEQYGYYKPYAELDSRGNIKIRGIPPPNVKPFGFPSPHSYSILGSRLLGYIWRKVSKTTLEQKGLIGFDSEFIYGNESNLNRSQLQLKNDAIQINRELLREVSSYLEKDGIPMVVVSAPTKREYSKSGSYGHEGIYLEAEIVLKETCEDLGIPFVATVEKLQGSDFWELDGHWRPSGHEKIAVEIEQYLRANSKISKK